MRITSASANIHKVDELRHLLAGLVDIVERPVDAGDISEDEPTLEGNATHKATVIARLVGGKALADDTGLEVAALGGAPGVRSARFAGPNATDADNREKLLRDLTAAADRRAAFRTVLALAEPDGTVHLFEGTCTGTIAVAERGSDGFGYDSLFVPDDGDGRTFAEMSQGEKNEMSHRARAVAALARWLADRL